MNNTKRNTPRSYGKRFTALKRYIGNYDKEWIKKQNIDNIEYKMNHPCKKNIDGIDYYCALNGYSIIATTEDIKDIQPYDNSKNDCINIDKFINVYNFDYSIDDIELHDRFDELRDSGFRNLLKDIYNENYLLKICGNYYVAAIVQQAFQIIDNGVNPTIYYSNMDNKPILIKTEIGMAYILPILRNIHYGGWENTKSTIVVVE